MTKLSELIDEAQSHHVTVTGSSGKQWFRLSLLWTIIIVVAAPQVLLLAALLYLLDAIEIAYDGRPLSFGTQPDEKEPPGATDAT